MKPANPCKRGVENEKKAFRRCFCLFAPFAMGEKEAAYAGFFNS
jgi:hypothetical protein